MRFRSHIGRSMDWRSPWNLGITVLTGVAGAVGLTLTVVADREVLLAVLAGGSTFLAWALGRELDPDRQLSAILAAVFAGGWVLAGFPAALLPFGALLLAARLLVESTGRRPLSSDLIVLVIFAAAVSFTRLGWVMGFGLAVAIYIDNGMAETRDRSAMWAAMGAAAGASIVASLTGAFSDELPQVRPLLVAGLGVIAVIALLRDPATPVSFTDSRNKRFLRQDRLQAARSLTGVLIVAGSIMAGATATAVVPMAITLLIAMISSEWERRARAGGLDE